MEGLVQQVKVKKNCSFYWLFTDEYMPTFPCGSIWTGSPDKHFGFGPALSYPIRKTDDYPIWANCLADPSG